MIFTTQQLELSPKPFTVDIWEQLSWPIVLGSVVGRAPAEEVLVSFSTIVRQGETVHSVCRKDYEVSNRLQPITDWIVDCRLSGLTFRDGTEDSVWPGHRVLERSNWPVNSKVEPSLREPRKDSERGLIVSVSERNDRIDFFRTVLVKGTSVGDAIVGLNVGVGFLVHGKVHQKSKSLRTKCRNVGTCEGAAA